MTRSLSTSTGPITISAEDAEKIKRQCGIPLEEEAKTEFLTDFGILSGEQISTMLRPTLEAGHGNKPHLHLLCLYV